MLDPELYLATYRQHHDELVAQAARAAAAREARRRRRRGAPSATDRLQVRWARVAERWSARPATARPAGEPTACCA